MPGQNEMLSAAKSGRGVQNAYARMKKKLHKEVRPFLAELPRFKRPVMIDFVWIEENRRRDPDNISAGKKFLLDSFVKCGILVDDGWKQIHSFGGDDFLVKKNPGVLVTITEVVD
jgi:Holliday junction resolvase RusA-like endonuclease